MATEVKFKELSMNYFVLGENIQVRKVSLKSETMREKFAPYLQRIALNTLSISTYTGKTFNEHIYAHSTKIYNSNKQVMS